MTLSAGTKLGPYEILAPIGAGGMGEVYRARDTKLDRDVAVKVLPAQLTANADALARFEREAKAVAALSHPNILAIHDFGTHDGVSYAVTELLEGETLRGKLDGAAVTQRQAVDWALQIAKGLSAAHGKGVVHRDLKPENVFVTNDGHVKILDFGLAKRADAAPGEQTSAPTSRRRPHGARDGDGHDGLHVARAGPRPAGRPPLGHLLLRRDPLRAALRQEGVQARHRERHDRRDHARRAARADAVGTQRLPRARSHRAPLPGEGPREPLPVGEGRGVRAVGVVVDHDRGLERLVRDSPAPPQPRKDARDRRRGRRRLAIAAAALLWNRSKLGGGGSPAKGGVKRIAVLPFENLGAPEDDYFADGIADEIRGKLTSLPGIEVIARGSSTPYKKTTKTPQEIAKELSANYLLNATVRWQKEGGASRVQVNPELVEIKPDGPPASKWQQPFNASLTDVFQVQSDIASKVAAALGLALAEGTEGAALREAHAESRRVRRVPQGRGGLGGRTSRSDPASLRKSLPFYEQAVAVDPSFALAWSRVSVVEALLYTNAVPTPLGPRARAQAAEKSIALAPHSPDGYRALGTYYRVVVGDSPRASFRSSRRRSRSHPADPTSFVPCPSSRQSRTVGRSARARATGDPTRPAGRELRASRHTHAPAASEGGEGGGGAPLAIAPSNLNFQELLAMTHLSDGDLQGARASVRQAAKSLGSGNARRLPGRI